MKTRALITGIAMLLATGAAHARNSDWRSQIVGAGGELTCGMFNKLNKARKEQAITWALGYISGMATSNTEEARMEHDHKRLAKLIEDKPKKSKLVATIKQQCLERPDVYFPLIVEWAYAEE